jgi:hypothetical protein
MTVKELIKFLKDEPEDLRVCVELLEFDSCINASTVVIKTVGDDDDDCCGRFESEGGERVVVIG